MNKRECLRGRSYRKWKPKGIRIGSFKWRAFQYELYGGFRMNRYMIKANCMKLKAAQEQEQ